MPLPLLAAATNSPMLLGRRLWHETRVALFERSVDARTRAELPLFVIATIRSGEPLSAELIGLLSDLRRGRQLEQVELDGLSETDHHRSARIAVKG